MLYINEKELREKGSLALLQNGAILKAIDKEIIKILNDIEDSDTDPTDKRKIKVEFIITSSPNRKSIGLEASINTVLAKRKVMNMRLSVDKVIEDDRLLVTMREETEEADGQLNIDGEVKEVDSITITAKEEPYEVIDAEFKENNEQESLI